MSREDITAFAKTNYRNAQKTFGIQTDDRGRHMYVIGKTGMGKSTMLENMIIQDIRKGYGLAVVDPHGDLVENIINYIPSYRTNDVIYFNPADIEHPIGFNVLEHSNPSQRHLVASGLMGVFTKIWEGVWSARMEYILNNTVLALLEYEGSTMLGIQRMLVDNKYRAQVLDKVTDPVVKSFWKDEYANYNERFRNEAIAPIQNKVGQFLSSAVIRNIVGQPKSKIDIRKAMDEKKILLLNLSKGRIGEDNSRLLGAMMITRIQLAAMSRVDIPEHERQDFYLYVDEFQNFATQSFANILSEARKYHLSLILAHQYIEQLDEMVRAAIFGNVGTMVTFRVGATDAEFLAKEYFPTFNETDLVNLRKYDIYLKLMIDGITSDPFSATTLPPVYQDEGNAQRIISVSRERYATPKSIVEEKIIRWSGVEEMFKKEAEESNEASKQYQPHFKNGKKNNGNNRKEVPSFDKLEPVLIDEKQSPPKKVEETKEEEVDKDATPELSLSEALQQHQQKLQSKKKPYRTNQSKGKRLSQGQSVRPN